MDGDVPLVLNNSFSHLEIRFTWDEIIPNQEWRFAFGHAENNVILQGWVQGTSPVVMHMHEGRSPANETSWNGPGHYWPLVRAPEHETLPATVGYSDQISWVADLCWKVLDQGL